MRSSWSHLVSAIARTIAKCATLGMWISAFSIVAMMCIIAAGTVSREVFGFAITGTDEMAGALVAMSVYMGLAYTFLDDGLIRVEFLRTRFSARFRNVSDRVLLVVATVYAVVLVAYFWRIAWISAEQNVDWVGVLHMPLFPWHVAMALGTTFLLFALVARMLGSHREGTPVLTAGCGPGPRTPIGQLPKEG